MKHAYIVRRSSPRLLLFFAGWGMDSNPFAALDAPDGYDLAVVWDYRDRQLDIELDRYEEICVVAWSFGVFMASLWLNDNSHLPVTRRIAVCGTLYPVDDSRGIPREIFAGTLNGLTPRTLDKFYMRMAGGRSACQAFFEKKPQRDVDGLSLELLAIDEAARDHKHLPGEMMMWDEVIVADEDHIIPTANQLAAWAGHPGLRIVHSPHMPDFGPLLRGAVISKELVRSRFADSRKTYGENAGVQREVASRLARMWLDSGAAGAAGKVIELGAGTGLFTGEYMRFASPSCLTLVDLTPVGDDLPGVKVTADAETYLHTIAEASVDAVVTASTMQWFNSPKSFLERCAAILRPGGVVVASTFGRKNYSELAPYAAAPVNYTDFADITAMLPEGLETVDAAEWSDTMEFASPGDLLRHMRLTGVNASSGGAISAARRIMADGVSALTYNPVCVVLRRKD